MSAHLLLVPVSYDYAGAAAATGVSADVIRRAVKAGDIAARFPVVNGRAIAKPLIEAEELRRWVGSGRVERTSADAAP